MYNAMNKKLLAICSCKTPLLHLDDGGHFMKVFWVCWRNFFCVIMFTKSLNLISNFLVKERKIVSSLIFMCMCKAFVFLNSMFEARCLLIYTHWNRNRWEYVLQNTGHNFLLNSLLTYLLGKGNIPSNLNIKHWSVCPRVFPM